MHDRDAFILLTMGEQRQGGGVGRGAAKRNRRRAY